MQNDIDNRIIKALDLFPEGLITKRLLKRVMPDGKGRRKFHKRLRTLRKDGKIIDKEIGREVVNYLPKHEEAFRKKYKKELERIDSESKRSIQEVPLQIRIEHTKKIQDKVIRPIFEWFENVRYDFAMGSPSIASSEERMEMMCKYGVPYFVIKTIWGKPPGVPISTLVESTFLLDDFVKNYAPKLFEIIDEFDEKFRKHRAISYEIHDRIRRLIVKVTGLNITSFSRLRDPSTKKTSSVTTNLQYVLYNRLDGEKIWDYPLSPISVEKHGEMYEYWLRDRDPAVCCLRKECKGRSKKEFREETNQKIRKILKEMRESEELLDLSAKIKSIREELFKLQGQILKNLERHLNVEVLDNKEDEKILEGGMLGPCVFRDGKMHPIIY